MGGGRLYGFLFRSSVGASIASIQPSFEMCSIFVWCCRVVYIGVCNVDYFYRIRSM